MTDNCSICINPPEGCVIYNVKCKYNDKLTEFIVHKLEEPVFNGYYDSNSSSDAVSLTLGQIPINTIVTIEISCTFTATLTTNNSFTFHIPTEENLLNSLFSANINILMPKNNRPQLKLSEGVSKIDKGHLIINQFALRKKFQITFEFQNPVESAAFSAQLHRSFHSSNDIEKCKC